MENINIKDNIDPDQLLLFFSVGYEWSPVFKSFSNPVGSEYNFYWLHDRYYTHQSIDLQPPYLHLFIQPAKKVSPRWFRSALEEDTIECAYRYNQSAYGLTDTPKNEPAILRCSATFVPDIVFKFKKRGCNNAISVFPDNLKGVDCNFFTKEHKVIPFVEILELTKLLPCIAEAVPVSAPKCNPTRNS